MSRFDELVSRIGSDPQIGIRPTRTDTGVTLDNGHIQIELRGPDHDFDGFVDSLSRDAKEALGTSDGLALYMANLEEDQDTLDESMIYVVGTREVTKRTST